MNHREPGYLDSVKAFAGERGVDVIMEMAAHTNLSADLDLLNKVSSRSFLWRNLSCPSPSTD